LTGELGDELYVAPGQDKEDAVIKATSGELKTPGFMTLMGSFEGYLMVYKDIKLAWTTKLQTQPIYVNTAVFQNKSGLIVTLADNGHLQISFLGTDQMSQTDLGKLHQTEKEVDYAQMEVKHLAIMERIKNTETE
jgi:hypothetical protein